jgi:hypothetical protein
MGTGGIVLADVASFTQWRSDSVLVPIVAATCTRLIPDATSTSGCCFCASSNLRACGGTSARAGAAALLLTFLVTFFLTMIASLPALPDRGARPGARPPPQLMLILCGITGPVSGKKSGVTTTNL